MNDAVGVVADLWRYPVKSFGGERRRHAFLGPFGILGDRRHALLGEDGQVLVARRLPALLGFRAHYAVDEAAEAALVDTPGGATLPWDDPRLVVEVGRAVGRQVHPVRSAGAVHDAAPVHLLSEASLRTLSELLGGEVDRRRFRANLYLELDDGEPFAEASWPGRRLAIGEQALVDVVVATERCAVTTFDPDTGERDKRVLATIAQERENLFGVYARVARPGWIEVGDAVRLLAGVAAPEADARLADTTRGGAVR